MEPEEVGVSLEEEAPVKRGFWGILKTVGSKIYQGIQAHCQQTCVRSHEHGADKQVAPSFKRSTTVDMIPPTMTCSSEGRVPAHILFVCSAVSLIPRRSHCSASLRSLPLCDPFHGQCRARACRKLVSSCRCIGLVFMDHCLERLEISGDSPSRRPVPWPNPDIRNSQP